MFPERVETDRLVLERLCRDTVDLREYTTHVGPDNPHAAEQYRHLPRDPCATLGEAADRLDRFEQAWDDGERAEYAIRPRPGGQTGGSAAERASGDERGYEPGDEAGELAGTGGLIFDWDRRVARPAINLRKPFWGRGYAGERARALIRLAFDRLDLEVVEVPVAVGNERSRRAVERYVADLGGEHLGVFRNDGARPDGPVDRHRFAVTRAQFERERTA